MMAKLIGILAIAVYVLVLLAVGLLDARAPQATVAVPPSPQRPVQERPVLPQLVGMGLNVYHSDQPELYTDAIDRIAAMGFNSVHVVTPVFQRDGSSIEVQQIVGPSRGPTPEELGRLLRYAKLKGLRTVFMPQINFTHPRGNEWRGLIHPDHWAQWWESYEQMLRRYLEIARQADVDVFAVGCELLSTQQPEHLARWERIISVARRQFNGALTYSTNWDSYHKVQFWDKLDAIGISGYWDLTTHARDEEAPTEAELARRWVEIRESVLGFAQSHDRPALITELGFPSLPWALRDPWNYPNPDSLPAEHEAQRRGYASFLQAWSELIQPPGPAADAAQDNAPDKRVTPGAQWQLPDPRVAGVLFYRWDVYYQGEANDTGYGIRGKPSHDLLRRWLQGEGVPAQEE